jgi:hypothetical protein
MPKNLVPENVFTDLKASGPANKDRQFHIGRDVIHRVIEAAPDAEWRLLIALSRFAACDTHRNTCLCAGKT